MTLSYKNINRHGQINNYFLKKELNRGETTLTFFGFKEREADIKPDEGKTQAHHVSLRDDRGALPVYSWRLSAVG